MKYSVFRKFESFSGRAHRLKVAACVLVAAMAASPLTGQDLAEERSRSVLSVGSELENYLRYQQVLGNVGFLPWSLRGFGMVQAEWLAPTPGHAWEERYPFAVAEGEPAPLVTILPAEVRTTYNSAFPFGFNDGPVWSGRGLTTSFSGGVAGRKGPFSLVIAPLLFSAQNAEFDLKTPRDPGEPYVDPIWRDYIDRPQRFGDSAYTRFDLGQSSLRYDNSLVSVGLSTANQHWGPASTFPLVLGNNAGGFPHLFLGTSRPLDIWIGEVHGRVVWGRISESPFSPVAADSSRRFMSGAVAIYTPRWVPGLEVGVSRFFHSPWTSEGLSAGSFLKPIEIPFKGYLPFTGIGPDENSDADNQLASVFGRLVLPSSGLEIYGEFAREDHAYNKRDFFVEPDNNSGYMLGFRKVWQGGTAEMTGLRAEVVNTQISHLDKVRFQAPFYVHGLTRQGHTNRGQVLGSASGTGGAASTIAVDRYVERGRVTLDWTRMLVADSANFLARGEELPESLDVMHSVGAEGVLFRGRYDVLGRLGGVYNFNRDFKEDVFNLHAVVGIRARL